VFAAGLKRGTTPEKWRSYSLQCLSSCVLSSAGSLLLHSGGENMISQRDFHYLCKYKCISSYIRCGGVETERILTDNNFTFGSHSAFKTVTSGEEKQIILSKEAWAANPPRAGALYWWQKRAAGRQNWASGDRRQTVSHLQAWEYLAGEGAFRRGVIAELTIIFMPLLLLPPEQLCSTTRFPSPGSPVCLQC